MDDPKLQLIDKLKTANNILVSVSRDPSVDQLAACLALTLALNKLGKHGTAVFSGIVPSIMEFLKPEETLEKNTDSLRDFIIALDKSKADKLRYKVEDDIVRIFITPYRTSISDADLEFSQGDFNVDVVVALGVTRQEDLDEAIVAHGRILHDATVASVTTVPDGDLGSINWHDPSASSLSELVAELTQAIAPNLLDEQIATALLTGIVAETARFSNEKTTPQTMSLSAVLMAAGANQQLIATKLDEPQSLPQSAPESKQHHHEEGQSQDAGDQPEPEEPPKQDGTLEIEHEDDKPEEAEESGQSQAQEDDQNQPQPESQTPDGSEQSTEAQPEQPVSVVDQPFAESTEPVTAPTIELPEPEVPAGQSDAPIEVPSLPDLPQTGETFPQADQLNAAPPAGNGLSAGSKLITEPPTMGGMLTANSHPEQLDPVTDPMSLAGGQQGAAFLNRTDPLTLAVPESVQVPTVPDPLPTPAPQNSGPMITGLTPPPPAWVPPSDDPFGLKDAPEPSSDETLTQIEAAVHSPHLEADGTPTPPAEGLDAARDEVLKALNQAPPAPEPIQALNAQQFGGDLHPTDVGFAPQTEQPQPPVQPLFSPPTEQPSAPANFDPQPPAGPVVTPTMPTSDLATPPAAPDLALPQPPIVSDPNGPPPVAPPFPFPMGGPTPPAQQ